MDKLVTEPQRESRVISSFINTEFRFLKDHDRQSMLECGEVASLELPEIAETLILKTEKDSADETNIQNTIDHHRSIPPCDNGGLTDDRTETIPETERETEIFLESDPKSLSGTESSVESDTRLTAENLYQCSIPQPDAMDAQEFIAKDDKSRISEEDNLATEFDNLETGYTPDKDKTVTVRHRNNASDDEDDEPAMYAESFRNSKWVFVGDDDENGITEDDSVGATESGAELSSLGSSPSGTQSSGSNMAAEDLKSKRSDSVSTTVSEFEFTRSYREVSIKRVQRKNSRQAYTRENTHMITADKTVHMEKSVDDGFGFHIVGSHPTSVSTVVAGGLADSTGVEVGDVILAVNYQSVLHLNHSEIVKALQNAGPSLTLEFCKASSFSTMATHKDKEVVFSGFMHKLVNSVFNIWKKRWFVLKSDNCLYYYKTNKTMDILGAIPLSGYTVQRAIDLTRAKDHAMKLVHHTKNYYFATENASLYAKWAHLLNQATCSQSNMDSWLDVSAHNVGLPALSIHNADCHGYLYKTGVKNKSWKRRYGVLKDGCLYYYLDIDSRSAQGVAHLHGYRVNASPTSTKKNSFSLMPPMGEEKLRSFNFSTDTEIEKERWIRAMTLSIGRWVKVD